MGDEPESLSGSEFTFGVGPAASELPVEDCVGDEPESSSESGTCVGDEDESFCVFEACVDGEPESSSGFGAWVGDELVSSGSELVFGVGAVELELLINEDCVGDEPASSSVAEASVGDEPKFDVCDGANPN